MIFTKVFHKDVGAGALDSEIGSLLVPDGYVITIIELGFTLKINTIVYGYVGEVKVDEIHGSYATTIVRRIIVNRELVAGQEFKLTATTVETDEPAVLVVYDKSKR